MSDFLRAACAGMRLSIDDFPMESFGVLHHRLPDEITRSAPLRRDHLRFSMR